MTMISHMPSQFMTLILLEIIIIAHFLRGFGSRLLQKGSNLKFKCQFHKVRYLRSNNLGGLKKKEITIGTDW